MAADATIGLDNVIKIVDSFMTLGVLAYMLYYQLRITAELRKENNAIRDKHMLEIKSANEQHIQLLERCMDELSKNRQFQERHIVGLEDRIGQKVGDVIDRKIK